VVRCIPAFPYAGNPTQDEKNAQRPVVSAGHSRANASLARLPVAQFRFAIAGCNNAAAHRPREGLGQHIR